MASASRFHSGGRYPVLRTIGIFYLIFAGLTAIAGVAGAVWTMVYAPTSLGERISLGLGVLAAAFFAMLAMLVIAEVIKLFIDVEHNTRIAAMAVAASRVEATAAPAASVVAPDSPLRSDTPAVDGGRITSYADEETAEAALLRGH